MTGFGRSETVDDEKKIIIEMKSVNHRYSDFTIKMPRRFNRYEAEMRNVLKENIERGKVDVFITFESLKKSNFSVRYNRDIAIEYFNYLSDMRQDFKLTEDFKPTVLARFPEVLTLEEDFDADDELYPDLEKTLRDAIANFTKAREVEGENLKNDMLAKLSRMSELVAIIEEMSPRIIEEYKQKLTQKISELMGDNQVDEARVMTEVTIYADKIAVDEEITRLKSHVSSCQNILNEGGAVGRKMDFIIQEMNREANTILSKSDSLKVTDIGIELKTIIEKIREQVQNIE
jgi:uncharacterized protein (TIGR00255 family)